MDSLLHAGEGTLPEVLPDPVVRDLSQITRIVLATVLLLLHIEHLFLHLLAGLFHIGPISTCANGSGNLGIVLICVLRRKEHTRGLETKFFQKALALRATSWPNLPASGWMNDPLRSFTRVTFPVC